MLRIRDTDVNGAARSGIAQIVKQSLHALVTVGAAPAGGAGTARIIAAALDDFGLRKVLDTLNALGTIRQILTGFGHRRHLQETLPEDFGYATRSHEGFTGI